MRKRIFDKTRFGESVFFYNILPQTRTGKSVLISSILVQDLSRGMSSGEFDSPETVECRDIQSFLSAEEIDDIFDNFEAGLKELSSTEQITFDLEAFSSSGERQQLAPLNEVS